MRKNNVIKCFVLLSVLLLSPSCTDRYGSLIPEGAESVNAFLNESDNSVATFNYSDLLDSVRYIALETNNECVMGMYGDVYYINDTLYISDYQSIFMFDKDGNYLRKIAKRGRGHGEYLQLGHFDVNRKNGEIYVHDYGKDMILVYSHEGEFMRSFPIQVVRDFAVTESGNFLFCYPDYTEVGRRGVWLTDKNGTFIKQLVSESDKYKSVVLKHNYFVKVNDSIISYMGGEDNNYIYHISEDTVRIAYKINTDITMSKKTMKKKIHDSDEVDFYFKDDHFENDRLLTFRVTNGKGKQVDVIYDKNEKREYQFLCDFNSNIITSPWGGEKYPIVLPSLFSGSDLLIVGISANNYVSFPEEIKNQMNISREVSTDGNMILGFVNIAE